MDLDAERKELEVPESLVGRQMKERATGTVWTVLDSAGYTEDLVPNLREVDGVTRFCASVLTCKDGLGNVKSVHSDEIGREYDLL